MKNYMKILAFFFAVLIMFSFGACSRQGATANKEWGFKANGKEYAIGLYLMAMNDAYEEAYSALYNQDSTFDTGDSILGIKSTFDESGKEYTVKEWMSVLTDKYLKRFAAIDYLMEKYDVEIDASLQEYANYYAGMMWHKGDLEGEFESGYTAYAQKEKYEPLGVSFESYYAASYLMGTKYNSIFTKLYSKGGEKEVSDKALSEFFEKNYTNYSFFLADLYEQTADEVTGEIITVPFNEEKTADIKEQFKTYIEMAQNGATTTEISDAYKKYANITGASVFEDYVQSYEEVKTNLTVEISDALKSMDNNVANVFYVGMEESPMAIFIYKSDVTKKTKEYLKDEVNYGDILKSMKSEEFEEYVVSIANNTKIEYNPIIESKFTAEYVEDKYRTYMAKYE